MRAPILMGPLENCAFVSHLPHTVRWCCRICLIGDVIVDGSLYLYSLFLSFHLSIWMSTTTTTTTMAIISVKNSNANYNIIHISKPFNQRWRNKRKHRQNLKMNIYLIQKACVQLCLLFSFDIGYLQVSANLCLLI